jgi:hypothetical protein
VVNTIVDVGRPQDILFDVYGTSDILQNAKSRRYDIASSGGSPCRDRVILLWATEGVKRDDKAGKCLWLWGVERGIVLLGWRMVA